MKKKYEDNEEYKEKKLIMEEKKEDYEQIKEKIKSYENSYSLKEEKYDNKIGEIKNIIKTIEDNKKKYPKRAEENIILSINLEIMYENNKEKINKIHNNENNIKELLKKLTENNEKIEVLDMQNKRINSEISSVESNIQNFEDTKKVHVSKKQFKEAQLANNEIKKCQENKAKIKHN